MAKPTIPDINTILQAGINPKTGLPARMGDTGCMLKENMKKVFRIIDEQDALNRFTWYNLPHGLDGNLMERILYYKGQGMFFFMPADERFYFLPYALDGTIDVYGRFTGVTPLPFNGSTTTNGKTKPWITGLTRKPLYDVQINEVTKDLFDNFCVLISDHSKQISQTNISRQLLNDPLLDVMSDCVPFMRTALQNGTGIQGMRVNTEDEQANVKLASAALNRAALAGEKWIPTLGNVDFQDLTGGEVARSEEFLLALQSLDNLRLSTYGLENGGLFQKKAHMLEAEQATNTGTAGFVLQDGLSARQNSCNIINSVTGLGIWCKVSEIASGADKNMDGEISDEDDGQRTVEQQPAGGTNNDM